MVPGEQLELFQQYFLPSFDLESRFIWWKSGPPGYVKHPVTVNKPVSPELLLKHLQGEIVIGLTGAESSRLILYDIDHPEPQLKDWEAVHRAVFGNAEPGLVFFNPNNRHYHLYDFLTEPVALGELRRLEQAFKANATGTPVEIYPSKRPVRLMFNREYYLTASITNPRPAFSGAPWEQLTGAVNWLRSGKVRSQDSARLKAYLEAQTAKARTEPPKLTYTPGRLTGWRREAEFYWRHGLQEPSSRNRILWTFIAPLVFNHKHPGATEGQFIAACFEWLDRAHNNLSKDYAKDPRNPQIERELRAMYKSLTRGAESFTGTPGQYNKLTPRERALLNGILRPFKELKPNQKKKLYQLLRALYLHAKANRTTRHRLSREWLRARGAHSRASGRFDPVRYLESKGLLRRLGDRKAYPGEAGEGNAQTIVLTFIERNEKLQEAAGNLWGGLNF